MTTPSHVEYGLFNIVPDTGIPPGWEWMYEGPFQVDQSKKVLEGRRDQINLERKRTFDRGEVYYQVTTYCEIRERTVSYSDWEKSGDSEA